MGEMSICGESPCACSVQGEMHSSAACPALSACQAARLCGPDQWGTASRGVPAAVSGPERGQEEACLLVGECARVLAGKESEGNKNLCAFTAASR